MVYNIKAHPTEYNGIMFRSRLEARWASFFDLLSKFNIGIKWEYEPIDLYGWTPDFLLEWTCGHSECNGKHSILIEVKPYFNLEQFKGHPCTKYPYGHLFNECGEITEICIPADASACFGINPKVTEWEMSHGSGGGIDTLEMWFGHNFDLEVLWNEAGNITRYKPNIG